jgi:A/G-specific adenine glycosylase
MELGETICLPNTMPHCEKCPIRSHCAVAGTERAAQLPTRAAAKPRKVEKRMVMTVISAEYPKKVLLHRRSPKGLLGGMWELPNFIVDDNKQAIVEQLLKSWNTTVLGEEPAPTGKHVFSHVEWQLCGCVLTVKPFLPPLDYVWADLKQLETYALPTAFRLYASALPKLLK